jgi:hypothetical protein
VELDECLVLRGRRLRRARHVGFGGRFTDRDDFLLGHLHRRWRVGHRDDHGDRRFARKRSFVQWSWPWLDAQAKQGLIASHSETHAKQGRDDWVTPFLSVTAGV